MGCLDENALVDLLEQKLPRDELDHVTAHLDQCKACRKLVSAMAAWYQPEPEQVPWTEEPETVSGTRGMLGVAGTLGTAGTRGTFATVPASQVGLAPGARVDRYILLRPLASGGMSVVYAAYDPELDRRLAIKFLRPETYAPLDDARLLREAQVMARLSHPNVVQLHDVGLADGRVFLVMELVEGQTLRHWLSTAPRSSDEVMAALLAAGRGLSAAHQAGVVHRDFKPENVLMGDDGRVRVMDFGLARARGPAASPDAPGAMSTGALTVPGALMGTPGYMAPEQLGGGRGDTRSDQFAFCVALHEALCGERPFAGETLEAYVNSLAAPRPIRPPPRRVPSRVWSAVARGLSTEPADRFPSMDELLEALQPGFWRRLERRTVAVSAACVLVVTATLAVGASMRRDPAGCEDPSEALAGAWDGGRRAAVLGSVQPAAGPERAEASASALDAYARRWSFAYAQVCGDGARERSDAQRTAGRACLDRRLADLGAVSRQLATADPPLARRALLLTGALPSPERCAEALPPPPSSEGPPAAAQLDALPRLREQVSLARALLAGGRAENALAALRGVIPGSDAAASTESGGGTRSPNAPVGGRTPATRDGEVPGSDAAASTTAGEGDRSFDFLAGGKRPAADSEAGRTAATSGDPALEAEARYLLGRAHASLGNLAAAERALLESVWAAERARHDDQAARSWIALYRLTGAERQDAARARELRPHVEAAVARTGGEDGLADDLREAVGLALAASGQPRAGVAHLERALEGANAAGEPLRIASVLESLGEAQGQAGELIAAERTLLRALISFDGLVGSDHPMTASVSVRYGAIRSALGFHDDAVQRLTSALRLASAAQREDPALRFRAEHALGEALQRAGRLQEALAHLREALGAAESAFGRNSPRAAPSLSALGDASRGLGNYDQALALHRRAAALSPLLSDALDGAGTDLRLLGKPNEAAALHRRALAMKEGALGEDHPEVGLILVGLGAATGAQGDHAGALVLHQRALVFLELGYGRDHPRLREALVAAAGEQQALGDTGGAVRSLERALALSPSKGPDQAAADARFALARVLAEAGQDSQRAVQLAAEARAAYALLGNSRQSEQVTKWLASRAR